MGAQEFVTSSQGIPQIGATSQLGVALPPQKAERRAEEAREQVGRGSQRRLAGEVDGEDGTQREHVRVRSHLPCLSPDSLIFYRHSHL